MRKLWLFVLVLSASGVFAAPRLEVERLSDGQYRSWPCPLALERDVDTAFDNVSITVRRVPRGVLTEYETKIVNDGAKTALLRFRLKTDVGRDGGSFWDGFAYWPQLKKTSIPKMNRYNFPAVSYLSDGELTAIGFAPQTISSRFERRCAVEDSRATLCFDAYVALNSGEGETLCFFSGAISGAVTYAEAVEAVYNAWPDYFRPVAGADPRIYGVGGYMLSSDNERNRRYYQLEDNRRLGLDWEWYYNSYQKSGDFFPSPELWDPKQGYKSEKSHAACDTPGTVADWRNNHRRRISAGDTTTAMFYYYMQQYLNCDLLKNVYKDAAWRDENGKPGFKAFNWGDEGWAEYAWPGVYGSYGAEVRSDLADLWRTFDIAGFSLDCVCGDVRYYGPWAAREPHRAFDDKGKIFVAEGVAVAYNLDFTHRLPAKPDGRRAASIVNEPYTYLPIFHSDATLHEMPPFERADKIAPRRLLLGQKPYFWWGGWKIDSVLDWDRLSPDEANKALTGVMDHTILMSLRYGAVPSVFFVRGFPDMLERRPLFRLLQRAGWRAAPYAWVDGVPGMDDPWAQDAAIWVSRFGDARESFIVLSVPNPRETRGQLRIQTKKFDAGGAVYADIDGAETVNVVTDSETVVTFALKDHAPLILRQVGRDGKGRVVARIFKDENDDKRVFIRSASDESIKRENAEVRFSPEPVSAWAPKLRLSDGRKALAVIVGDADAVRQIGPPARNLEIYMEYYRAREKRPEQRLYLMEGYFDPASRFPVLRLGAPEAEKAETVFALGRAARDAYFPGVTVTDTIVCREEKGKRFVGFFPGKLDEGKLIIALLEKLDAYYPYYGANCSWRWSQAHGMRGMTYVKGRPTLSDAIGSPTAPVKRTSKTAKTGEKAK